MWTRHIFTLQRHKFLRQLSVTSKICPLKLRTYASIITRLIYHSYFRLTLQLKKVEGSVPICWLIKKEARWNTSVWADKLPVIVMEISCGSNVVPSITAHSALCGPVSWGCNITTSIELIDHGTGVYRLGSHHWENHIPSLILWIPYYTSSFKHISIWIVMHDLWTQMVKCHRSSCGMLRQNSNNGCRGLRRILICGVVCSATALNSKWCNTAVTGLAWLRWVWALAVCLQLLWLLMVDIMLCRRKQNCVALAIKRRHDFMMLLLRWRVWRLHNQTSWKWLSGTIGRLLRTVWRIHECDLRSTLSMRRRRFLLNYLWWNLLNTVLVMLRDKGLRSPCLWLMMLSRHL